MTSTIIVHSYLPENNLIEEVIGKDDKIVCVEDLIFKIGSTIIGVNPIGIHLFALFDQVQLFWLCPSQKLIELQHDLKQLNFILKIRYLPFRSENLLVSIC